MAGALQNNTLTPYFGLTSSFFQGVNKPIYRQDDGTFDLGALSMRVLNVALPLIAALNILLLPFIAIANSCAKRQAAVEPDELGRIRINGREFIRVDRKKAICGHIRNIAEVVRPMPLLCKHSLLISALACDQPNLDVFSGFRLHSANPVHFQDRGVNREGYEITFKDNSESFVYYVSMHENGQYLARPAQVSAVRPHENPAILGELDVDDAPEEPIAPNERQQNVFQLLSVLRDLERAILDKSLHFGNRDGLYVQIKNLFLEHYGDMDYSQLNIRSVEPISCTYMNLSLGREVQDEGYRVTFNSPNGPIQYVVSKRPGGMTCPFRILRNVRLIENVESFLLQSKLDNNAMIRLNLPLDTEQLARLHLLLASQFPGLDFCQLRLDDVREVTFEGIYGPFQDGHTHEVFATDSKPGHMIRLLSPGGPIPCFVHNDGGVYMSDNVMHVR